MLLNHLKKDFYLTNVTATPEFECVNFGRSAVWHLPKTFNIKCEFTKCSADLGLSPNYKIYHNLYWFIDF